MDKAALLANRATVNSEDVEIPGVGTVKVRGLSRFELLLAQKNYPDDPLAQERFTLSVAMIDPEMSEQDILIWQKNSGPMEINEVSTVVNRLSGIGAGADKAAYKSAGDDTSA